MRKAYGIKAHNRTTIPDIVLGTQLEVLSASPITKELFTIPAVLYGCLFVVHSPRLYSANYIFLGFFLDSLPLPPLFIPFLYYFHAFYIAFHYFCVPPLLIPSVAVAALWFSIFSSLSAGRQEMMMMMMVI